MTDATRTRRPSARCALRDGLQIEEPIPLSAKLELLEAVVATGVREMEATAFVSPSKVPALADAAELAAELHDDSHGIEFSALVASPNGAKRAIAAGLRLDRIRGVGSRRAQPRQRRALARAEATALIAEIVAIAHDSGATVEVIIATRVGLPVRRPDTAAAGARRRRQRRARPDVDRLAIADTIGTTTPRRVSDADRAGPAGDRRHPAGRALPQHPRRRPGQRVRRGAAPGSPGWTPRSAGWAAARSRPGASGNIATEDLVYLLRDSGIDVDVDLQAAIAAARRRAARRRPRPAERAAARRRPDPRLS